MTMRTLVAAIAVAAAIGCDRTAIRQNASNDSPALATSSDTDLRPVATTGPDGALARGADPRTYREVTIPAGTVLPLALDSRVASDSSRVEDPVRAHLRRAVVVNGATAIPAGSAVSGVVVDAKRSAKVKGRARVAMRFTSLHPSRGDETYAIRTGVVSRQAPGTKRKDAAKIAIPAAGGAIVGAIAGGKKGAAIGTAVGGGAGTAVVLTTRGKEVRLGPGAAIAAKLLEPVTVRVPQ